MDDLEEQARAAGEMLERSLMKAVSSVESELARVVRTGEADLDRLARKVAETLARLAVDSALGAGDARPGDGDTPGSLNSVAAAIARAARRGARFT